MARINFNLIKQVIIFSLIGSSSMAYALNPTETIKEIFTAKAGSKYQDESDGKDLTPFLNANKCPKHYPWGEPRFKDSSVYDRSLFFCRSDFAIQYDHKVKVPLWTIETLIGEKNFMPRNGQVDFKHKQDEQIPIKMQPYPEDYVNSPYYPRQLATYTNLPLLTYGQRNKNPLPFEERFKFTNTVPMIYDNLANTIWSDLEAQIRLWSKQKNYLYITTGVIYLNGQTNGMLPKSKTLIPTHFYKIISHPNSHGTVSYIIPNKEILTSRTTKINNPKNVYTCKGGPCSVSDFIVTIQEIERLTNIEFYPKLAPYWATKVKLDVNEIFKYEKRALENENE